MGRSLYIDGFKPADDKWKRMKDVWESCESAGIQPPKEVGEFFGWEKPDDAGVRVSLSVLAPGVTEWSDDNYSGLEIDLRKLDPNIKVIRVMW